MPDGTMGQVLPAMTCHDVQANGRSGRHSHIPSPGAWSLYPGQGL